MLCNSWVAVELSTGSAVWEFYNVSIIAKINTDKYRVMTTYDYLVGLNHPGHAATLTGG